jgi:hypothetical protein
MRVVLPFEGTYQNNNLFYFPEAYERLENIVKAYPTDKLVTSVAFKPERRSGCLLLKFASKTNSPVEKFIIFVKLPKVL